MTATAQTCYTLICDGCRQVVYDDGEGRENHFHSAEALRFDAENYGDWSRDGERDLCPKCTCAAVGHKPRVDGGGSYVECTRCYEPLTEAISVTPNEAFL